MYKHWHLNKDSDNILWLAFDRQDADVNTINQEVMTEFSVILDQIKNSNEYSGVIISSAKKTGFIAGADVSQFKQFKTIEQAITMVTEGQAVFNKLAGLKIPTVAMIDGFCLGGGLELALACRYRIAEEGVKTRLGLPEVKLGIQPGWGGSVRLPRLIGGVQALSLIMAGQLVSSKTAEKMGFVDVTVPKRHLARAAKSYVLTKPKPHAASITQSLSNSTLGRFILAPFIRKQLRNKANPLYYPAPFAVLDNWQYVGVLNDRAFQAEAKSCGKLFFSDTCQNLVRVFYLQNQLKSLGKEVQFAPQHIHVVGAGTMGGDIAAWCALQGMRVTLQDREEKLLTPAIKRAYQLFKDKLKENYLVQKAMDRLQPDVAGDGIFHADIIVEAIFEDLSAKQTLFKSLEEKAKPEAIFATNTSSILLDDINKVLQNPGRLVGVHFFNPVAKMMLVEVVKGERTDAAVYDKALAFARKIDRLPLPVKSSPGFLVNRILMPYLLESMVMLEEGIPATVIDKAMLAFGMPMGPITLADTVGLDVCLSVANYLGKYLKTSTPKRLADMVAKGYLGKKSGQGFYQYKQGKQVKIPAPHYDKPLETISDRLVGCMIKESFACLREGVVASGDLLDAGMIFGTGFAPFRGGPIHYAKSHGVAIPFLEGEKVGSS
ncbi:crotonase [Gammaproteobacteria bacterium SCGC AG-212-F23]|nr:crotonase [Gammaproteobacteria bacterium SCGC AG-212-F23]